MISDHRIRIGKKLNRGTIHDFTGRLEIYIEPRDLWVGVYVALDAVYVCPLPCLVLRWAR